MRRSRTAPTGTSTVRHALTVACALVFGAGAGLAGCARTEGDASDRPRAGATAGHTVEIVDRAFEPRSLVVGVGEQVTFVNRDVLAHRVVWLDEPPPDGAPPRADVPDSGELGKDQTHTVSFSAPGTYRYHCIIHNHMKGEVVVR